MKTAMENIREMVDVNTVVGDPVETHDGSVIVPVTRVSFGFAAGGGELGGRRGSPDADRDSGQDGGEAGGRSGRFAGGSGAGVSVHPIGFLVVGKDSVRMLSVEGTNSLDRLLDMVPQLIDKFTSGRAGGGGDAGEQQRDQKNEPSFQGYRV